MNLLKSTLLLVLIIGISGCYNAKVTTGLEPSAKEYEQSFASSWIYGLVPPKTVEAAEQCNNGVAMVETKLSFVNMLVGNLTLGIYTPMHITVTCATSSASKQINQSKDNVLTRKADDIKQDIQRASKKAVETQKTVYLKVK
ncbi:Bor family protein [Aliifodinibius sp. S!AR15-10]|uniref:Bor family protein n=1 Tax=Aliifodinibius sp. S!AR15-10 TaxID=2950437 RepID=UPI002854C366|nr:Bor family protein [Aliifodinibius sp. S!AR15-10]MDR8393165.1 Bor family protein [Aliifodinibius sp. S!AR15-10]